MGKIVVIILVLLVVCVNPAFGVNRYLDNEGNNLYNGLTINTPWATMKFAADSLNAGDTLFIMGGVYWTYQFMGDSGGSDFPSGSGGNHIVLKAYGDSIAYFYRARDGENSEHPSDSNEYWFFNVAGGSHHFTLDGWSHLDPADTTSWLYFQPGKHDGYSFANDNRCHSLIRGGENSGSSHHITLRGINFSGEWGMWDDDSGWSGVWGWVRVHSADYYDISHCHFTHAGDSAVGSGVGYGIIFNEGSCFNKVTNCYFAKAGHGHVEVWDSSCYNIFRDDTVTSEGWSGYGFGFTGYGEVGGGSNYNLVEDCYIIRVGDAFCGGWDGCDSEYPKPICQMSSSYNVFRRNIMHSPKNEGWVFEGGHAGGKQKYSDYNMLYNNTIYDIGGFYGVVDFKCLDNSVSHNLVANNIIFRNNYQFRNPNGTPVYCNPVVAIADWIAGSVVTGNIVKNNLIRQYYHTGEYDSAIVINTAEPGVESVPYSVANAELLTDPVLTMNTTIEDNVIFRPMFESEDPEAAGFFSNWWHLKPESQCIDAGYVVNDWITPQIDSAWTAQGLVSGIVDTLVYYGNVPDIGAFEAQIPACSLSLTLIEFGNVDVGEMPVKYLKIFNLGDGMLVAHFKEWSNPLHVFTPPQPMSVAAADSAVVGFRFVPRRAGLNVILVAVEIASPGEPCASNVTVTGTGVGEDASSKPEERPIRGASSGTLQGTGPSTEFTIAPPGFSGGDGLCDFPVISGVSDSPLTDSCLIEFTTNINATGQVLYAKVTDIIWNDGIKVPTSKEGNTTSHSIWLTELDSGTEYKYKERSCVAADTHCCSNYTPQDTFMTDCVEMEYSNFVAADAIFGAVFVYWTSSENADYKDVQWKLVGGWTDCADDLASGKSHNMLLCGLTRQSNKSYYYRVRNMDVCGDWGDWSAEHGFSTDGDAEIYVYW